MSKEKADGVFRIDHGIQPMSAFIGFDGAQTITIGKSDDRTETPMDKKTRKLVEKIENAVGGKVAIRPEGELSYQASWTSHSGRDIISGVFEHSKREAVKELLYELRRHGKRIEKIKR